MKVFLSWSGQLSKRVAEELRQWLPNVIQALEPWLSSEDIGKGSRWSSHVTSELAASKAGIICVTPDNHNAPWLNFEAGAISNNVETVIQGLHLADRNEAYGSRWPADSVSGHSTFRADTDALWVNSTTLWKKMLSLKRSWMRPLRFGGHNLKVHLIPLAQSSFQPDRSAHHKK